MSEPAMAAGGYLLRAYRVGAGLLTLAAAVVWLTPVNVPGGNFQPYGCGSAAAPTPGGLSRLVCDSNLTATRGNALALVIAAVLLLLLGELLAGKARRGRDLAPLWALLPALPILTLSVMNLFTPLTAHGADGSKFRCGTALAPVSDALTKGQCGDLSGARLATTLGAALGALLLVGGAAYVGRAGQPPAQAPAAPEKEPGSAGGGA